MKEVIVIIPTYNESENITRIIESIFSIHQDINILVVDDNSPDGTSNKVKEVISKFNNKLNLITRNSKMGLGSAYLTGFKWAINKSFKYIISMDKYILYYLIHQKKDNYYLEGDDPSR